MKNTIETTRSENLLQEMRNAIKAGVAEILTIPLAKELKGKKIKTLYFGHSGQDGYNEFIVGDVVSKWEYYKTQPCEGYESRTSNWESFMTPEQINKEKNRFILLDSNGDNSAMFFCDKTDIEYRESEIFCCSDSDRYVYYIIAE